MKAKPLVGLLHNPAVPVVVDEMSDLVEYIEVIPERFWYDCGTENRNGRFHRVEEAIKTFKRCAIGKTIAGHGIGLSLPSAIPLDVSLLDQIAGLSHELDFAWYSEHMSMFLTPHGSVPNAQAGLGLPVVYDDETFRIISGKVEELRNRLHCRILLENGSIFTAIPDMGMSEPDFFNLLFNEIDCGMLLDLHNLYVTARNGNVEPYKYLETLEPAIVEEVHMAGGDVLAGFYTDSHSNFSPAEVWEFAAEFVPRFPNLKAIIFEFHESYFERLGLKGIAGELEQLHVLAQSCTKEASVYA